MALGGEALVAAQRSGGSRLQPLPPGVKIGTTAGQPAEEHILFLKQLGITWVSLIGRPEEATAEDFIRIRKQWEAAGLKVYNIGSGVGPGGSLHNMPEVTLNLPGRDKKIEEYLNYIRYLGKAGIPYTTYAHMGNGIWSSGWTTLPRGYQSREVNMASPQLRGDWAGVTYTEPLSHGRKYSEEEIWDNYAYFIKKVVPVAEEAGVRIGIHPDDPPQPVVAGVPRCIFSNFEGYRKALEIANSPNIGVCLCVGCWLEGGELMGKDVVEAIKYFASQKKLFKVHLRNVSAPLPHSVETLLDDGYYDMYKVIKALVEVGFDGLVIPDHVPALGVLPGCREDTSGTEEYRPSELMAFNNAGLAYSIGYMNALLNAAKSETGRS